MKTALFATAVLSLAASARAEQPPAHATFALILGVNRSVDPEAKLLRYADDDAARYLELFRSLGARSYVLTRPDANTAALHPQERVGPDRLVGNDSKRFSSAH